MGLAGVLEGRGPEREQAGRVDARRHLGDLLLNGAEGGDGLAELAALTGVLDGRIQARLGDADGLAGDADAPRVEQRQRDGETAVDLAQHVGGGHAHVVELQLDGRRTAQAHLPFLLAGRIAVPSGLDDEGRDALVAPSGDRSGRRR